MASVFKRILVGKPLASSEQEHHSLGKPVAHSRPNTVVTSVPFHVAVNGRITVATAPEGASSIEAPEPSGRKRT